MISRIKNNFTELMESLFIKKDEILDEVNSGASKRYGAFWYNTGRFLYVPLAMLLCIIALSMHISF